ncbi:MBL fold metallo-hydrolase [Candidatus Desulfarcum epimagneticum]|uniref:MBL fold metallo-hydrolase n=1 Tax=uncultured Desulfobacteraceae bacterium TaxID=218296 RepID=A0A484HJE7_9BACT|nr:MBL fold metallo-hydrolase [uncultured Desulfobacteraceae bacterium]
MIVTIWGTRGSIPTPGPKTVRHGGNTSCVAARFDDVFVIFDAGTGIRVLGDHIAQTGRAFDGHLFLSHMHWDHIQGFPFFTPAYVPGNRLRIYEHQDLSRGLKGLFERGMKSPNFPVEMKEMGASISFLPFQNPVEIRSGPDVVAHVDHARLNHPDISLGYRIEDLSSGKTFVYATDTEHTPGEPPDERLRKLAMGADILLYDAQYTEEEYEGIGGLPSRKGWGHSTWKEGLKMASAAGVPRLVLFHHDPGHDDGFLEAVERKAYDYLKKNQTALAGVESVEMAREGMDL